MRVRVTIQFIVQIETFLRVKGGAINHFTRTRIKQNCPRETKT